MNTSEVPGAPGAPDRPTDLVEEAMAREIARLANQLFSGWSPGVGGAALPLAGDGSPGFSAPPHVGPSALALGGGGLSPGLTGPPLTGLVQLPVASAPPPRESDLRNLPAMITETFPLVTPGGPAGGLEAPGPLVGTSPPTAGALPLQPSGLPMPGATPGATSGATPGAQPYFLDLARPAAGPSLAGPPVDEPALSSARAVPTADSQAASAPANPAAPSPFDFRPALVPDLSSPGGQFDPLSIKADFPILRQRVHGGRRLVWLDNAATTQKPQAVIDRLSHFYEHENSNIHRAAHTLAARATDAHEAARDKTRRFLNAPSPKEIVFVRGTTEAINLVAQSWGRRNVGAGDEIVITWLEHHANIVPWQQLCAEKGACLRVVPVDDRGQVILEEYEKLLGPRTRLVSVSQVSNALGTIVPVREMVEMAHRHGARVLVDGAQAVSHMRVDVQAIDCDFYCFSGHKIFGPTGIGALYGKREVLEAMPPWQGGGNMISDVTFERTRYQDPPMRFEAGTGNIADAVGLGAALDYVSALGIENIGRYEHELLEYGTERLSRVPGLRFIGTAPEKAGVLSFVLDGVRTEDMSGALDQEGIAVRSGHHCAQPILRRFGVESTVRASLAPYNTREDLDALVEALMRIQTGRPPR